MKWTRNRFLLLPYVILLTVLAVVGCTSKEDPSETLPLCGNHSCGDLVMVTTDTSSDGFHYLNPKMSPDGQTILFTADWWALPADPRFDGDDAFTNNRQLILFPNQVGVEPTLDLESQGAELIFLFEREMQYGGATVFLGPAEVTNDDKSGPLWFDDNHVIFSLRDVNLGSQYRLCRADISDPEVARFEFLYMEPIDNTTSPQHFQHLEAALSPDLTTVAEPNKPRWLAFTRSGCVKPDSFRTCTGTAVWVLNMNTAGDNDGYDAVAFPVTAEYSRIETPHWSADGTKLLFSGGLDVAGAGTGAGTEIFSIDFDAVAAEANGAVTIDHNLNRLTFTERAAGDPIAGILNYAPNFSTDGGTIFFTSSRRAPSITLHDRNIWRIPANGTLDPVIHYFTRADDVDPTVLADGRVLLSSSLGFPTEMLNRLEQEAYLRISEADTLGLDEVQLRDLASDERRQLEFFEGVMSHIYIYRP